MKLIKTSPIHLLILLIAVTTLIATCEELSSFNSQSQYILKSKTYDYCNYQSYTEQPFFKGKYKDMVIELKLLDDSLLVTIININTIECFQQEVDASYIQRNRELSFMFESPKEMMTYLINRFHKVIITEGGEITFDVQLLGKGKPKIVSIKVNKIQVNKYGIWMIKFKLMKDYFQNQNKMLKDQVKTLKKQFYIYKNLTSQKIKELSAIMTLLQKTAEQNISYVYKILPSAISHPQNPHNKYFTTRASCNSIIVMHTSANNWYNFILRDQVTPGSKKVFKTRIIKQVSQGYMHFGFGTKSIFGVPSNEQPQIILYRTSGHYYEGGSVKFIGAKSQRGDQISCEIDLIQNKANWMKNGIRILSTVIPQQMRNKPLFFVIYFYDKDSEIEIILD